MSPSDCNGKRQQCDLPAGRGGSTSRLRVGYATEIPSSVRYRPWGGLAGSEPHLALWRAALAGGAPVQLTRPASKAAAQVQYVAGQERWGRTELSNRLPGPGAPNG